MVTTWRLGLDHYTGIRPEPKIIFFPNSYGPGIMLSP
jgi:hypothetical protein